MVISGKIFNVHYSPTKSSFFFLSQTRFQWRESKRMNLTKSVANLSTLFFHLSEIPSYAFWNGGLRYTDTYDFNTRHITCTSTLKSIFHLFINLRKIVALIFHQHRYRKQEEIEIKFNILKRILDGIKRPPVIQWSIGKTCLMLNFLTYLIKNININFLIEEYDGCRTDWFHDESCHISMCCHIAHHSSVASHIHTPYEADWQPEIIIARMHINCITRKRR